MDCMTAKGYLSDCYDGELSPELAMEVRLHIDRCHACSAELKSFGEIARMMKDEEQSHPPQGLWGQISDRLEEHTGIRQIRVVRMLKASLVPVLVACLLISVGMWWRSRNDALHAQSHASLAVNMQHVLGQFPDDPVKVVDTLSEEYAGRKVSFDDAEKLLGYRPAAQRLSAGGYQLTSTHVLKMPCCTCSASIVSRIDGSEFLIFEHNEAQPMWFGDAPSVVAKCGQKSCRCIQLPKQLAVTWLEGKRHVTVIGAASIDEVPRLVAAMESESPAG